MDKLRWARIGSLLLALVLTPPAFGAEGGPADQGALTTVPADTPAMADDSVAQPSVKNRAMEEIVVTAQKREERLQDVPISIQAFSGDAMAARGIENTTQLGQVVPSLQYTGVAGYTLIYIRGIGTDNFIPSADPSIATYIDGIYIPAGHTASTSLGNIERVEVLKGPQGTLFGRNATGGAISIVTREPDDQFRVSAEVEGGNFADRSAKLNLSGPITRWLAAGFSGAWAYEDSYYTDINYKTQPTKLGAARLKLNFHPTDTLSLGLTGYYSQQMGLGTLIGNNTTPSKLGRLLLIKPEPDDYTAQSDRHAGSKAQQDVFYGNLTWKTPWLDVKLLGSDEYILTDHAFVDFDGSPVPIASFTAPHEYTKMQTGELQLVSNDRSWGADKFKWVAGLYYLHSLAGFDPASLELAPQGLVDFAKLVGLDVPAGLQNLISKLPAQYSPLGDTGVEVSFGGLLETRSYSAYTQGTYTFTDWLDLTLGGRFQREKRFLTKSITGLVNPVNGDVLALFDFPLPSATATNFSPKAVLSLHLGENELVYASYSVGFKSGTFNVVNIYTPANYIVPEQVKSYEFGAKLEFFHGLVRVNGAVYDNEIKNLQSGFVSLLSGGAVQFLTAPAARTRGAEIDGTWLPLPDLNPGLLLTGNAGYVDAVYTDFPDGSGFQTGSGIYATGLDFSGNRIVRTPKLSGGLGLVQTIDVSHGAYELAVDEYYNSGFYYDPYNTVKESPYAVLNAHAGYLYTPWNARVTLFGKNVLDRRYHVQRFQTDFGVIDSRAAPREYGIRLNWDF